MSGENFKEEFVKLLRQFTGPSTYKCGRWVDPLSKQQILDVVQEVLDAKLDVTLVDGTPDDVRTPASGIVVTTPDAPDIPKINIDPGSDAPEKFASLDSLVAESRANPPNDSLRHSDESVSVLNVEENNNDFAVGLSDTRLEERKFMSKSTPSVNTLTRSDTFVRDEEFQSVADGDVFESKKIETLTTNGANFERPGSEQIFPGSNLSDFVKKLNTLNEDATHMLNIIQEMQKDVSDNIRPIRRLSAIGSFPGQNRTSKLTRRSLSAFPGTPTSSRLTPGTTGTIKASANARRKSTSTILAASGVASKLVTPTTYRSASSSALTLPKSTSLPPASQPKSAKPQKPMGLRSPSCPQVNLSEKSATRRSMTQHAPSASGRPGITLGKRKASGNV